MTTRRTQGPVMKVHMSTGTFKFTQQLRVHVGTKTAAPGGSAGHIKLAFANTVQRVAITATGGTFTLTVGGFTTAAIAYNADPATVEAAIIAAYTDKVVGDQAVEVRGTAKNLLIEFMGEFAHKDVAAISIGTGSLTGGTGTVTVVQHGNAGDVNPLVGNNDDPMSTKLIESQAIAIGNIVSPTAPVGILIRSGTVTIPVDPSSGEEQTRKYWRGNTFGKRLGLSNA